MLYTDQERNGKGIVCGDFEFVCPYCFQHNKGIRTDQIPQRGETINCGYCKKKIMVTDTAGYIKCKKKIISAQR